MGAPGGVTRTAFRAALSRPTALLASGGSLPPDGSRSPGNALAANRTRSSTARAPASQEPFLTSAPSVDSVLPKSTANDVADQLAQSQKLLAEAEKPVDERAAKADEIKQLLAKQLEDMGVTLQTSGKGTVGTARAGGAAA